ncbi:MAG: protein DpdD [Polyangiaceae bacterium]
MTDAETTTPERFLERFFGKGNDLTPSKPQLARPLQPWTLRVLEQKDRLLLPCQRNGELTWYAIARSARDARVLREELLAAVGPSYTDFRGMGARLERSDPIDSAVLDFGGRHVFKLAVVDPNLKNDCRQALARMLGLHDRRPPVQAHSPRIPGLVFRDLEFAIQQRDREVADAAVEELLAGGFLDGQNQRFVVIRIAEAFGDWLTILEELDAGTVIQLRRPVRITQALLRAVYQNELAQFEQQVQPRDALERFQQLRPRIAALMETREGMSAPEVAKLFMLKAAALGDPRLRDSVLEGSHLQGADKVYLAALSDLVDSGPPSHLIPRIEEDDAVEAYLCGDKDRALELLVAGSGGERRIGLLLSCALDLGTLRVAGIALAEFQKLTSSEQQAVRDDPRLARHLTRLEERYTTPNATVPRGWLDWAQMLASEALDDNRVMELASQGAAEWSLDELVAHPADIAQLSEALLAMPEQCKQALRHALPHLQGFLLPDDVPRDPLKPALRALLELYAFDEARSTSTLRAALSVLERVVGCGVSDEEYTYVVELLEVLMSRGLPLDVVDDTLDALEALIVTAPDRAPTIRAGALVQDSLQRWRARLTLNQIELCNQLSDDLGLGAAFPLTDEAAVDFEARTGLEHLAGKSVALYSLNAKALTRVASTLKANVSDVRVQTFDDKVGGNPALRHAAKTVDVFLIVTGAAKHSATDFIEKERGTRVILRTHGKGSASMLRVLSAPPS